MYACGYKCIGIYVYGMLYELMKWCRVYGLCVNYAYELVIFAWSCETVWLNVCICMDTYIQVLCLTWLKYEWCMYMRLRDVND